MNKRDFLKTAGLASLGFAAMSKTVVAKTEAGSQAPSCHTDKKGFKNWVWINPNPQETDEQRYNRYAMYKAHGITGVFFEADHEASFHTAKNMGLETHRWIWIMNRNDKELLKNHPEMYAVNRKGESCANQPPYVDYYRWLCPSKDETLSYLEELVSKEASKVYVDGIHLDYIRYCDIFLPVTLWDNYKLVQTQEMQEFDYCYCTTCQEKFKKETGHQLLDLKYPSDSPSWMQFRFDRINHIVNHLAKLVHETYKKTITAAVFPTPFIARRNVRQDWTNWNLDGVCPMIYHGFYNENTSWIETAACEGVRTLNGKFPLYAGLYLPSFANTLELEEGVRRAIKGGAKGVAIFSDPSEDQLIAMEKGLKG